MPAPKVRALGAVMLTLAGLTPWAGAHADALTADQILGNFNVVVFGQFTEGNETEGRVAVGGNLLTTGGGTHNVCFNGCSGDVTLGGTTWGALNVYGNAGGSAGISVQNGDAFVAGSNSLGFAFPSGGSGLYVQGNNSGSVTENGDLHVASGSTNTGTSQNGHLYHNSATVVSQPSFASTFTAPLTTLSDELAAIPGAAPVYNSSSQSYVYDAAAQLVDGVEMTVYDLNTTGVSLSAYLRNFNLGSTGTVVFNVIGPVTDYAFLNAFSDDSQVIWNFNTQTAVDLGTWYGAVLAPDATVTFSGDENGSVVADNLITNSEVHDIAFTGETPSLTLTTGPTNTDSTTPAPEPASLAVLGAGIAGLAFARRSRFRLRAKLS